MQLVIAEKPSVAKSIAEVIGALKSKDGYMEGNGYIVSWCVGHLVEAALPEAYKEEWKKWSYESLPMIPEKWKYEVKKDTKDQYQVLKKLMHDPKVESVVCATDAGREGELIFRLVYDMAGCKKPIERLWISSMEESSIKEGMKNLKPGREYENLYYAALLRMQADWMVGLNGSRLYTVLYSGKVLHIGRVQTPTLDMLVEREKKIQNFEKEQYFKVHILCDGIDASTGRIDRKEEAEEIMAACKGGKAYVTSVIKEEKHTAPPKLYDLTTLQRDANRIFGYTAKQTLDTMQSLYEKKLTTYPRTDSQYLSDDMGRTAEAVIQAVIDTALLPETDMSDPDIGRILNSKKVTDHHAIIPTIEIENVDIDALSARERRLLALTANRLLCATGQRYVYESVKVELDCNGHTFSALGKNILCSGFKELEESFRHTFRGALNKEEEQEERELPELSEGQVFSKIETDISEHYTNPQKRYTEDSLLSAMEHAGDKDMGEDVERKGIGTPATRADIIEKLVRDGYVIREKKLLIPTQDGINLISILPDEVKSPKLTADWENTLSLVAKGEYPVEKFMDGIVAMVTDLVRTCHKPSEEEKKMFEKEPEVMGMCPICGHDVINIKGKKDGEAYDYFKCSKKDCQFRLYREFGGLYNIIKRKITDKDVKSLLLPSGLTTECVSRTGSKYKANIKPMSSLKEYKGKMYPDYELIPLRKW